jgi:hypothetical protein
VIAISSQTYGSVICLLRDRIVPDRSLRWHRAKTKTPPFLEAFFLAYACLLMARVVLGTVDLA